MTATIDSPVRLAALEGKPPPVRTEPLSRCLAAALDASDAADLLGLDSQQLRAAHDTGARRVGFPGDAYVLALVGGTGVGKSSLLNALAGGDVSQASARRPTTAEPIAWIPRTEREALEPLLDWLDVRETREHETTGLGSVAILDLPDMDSVASEHRARVEALLPLVDAVAWVTDHEKYADAVLHDEFLRSWLPRLGRQVVLVNKADRVTDGDARRIQRDLEADLASGVIRGSEVPVLRSSAVSPDGTGAFRAWLDAGAESKRVVRGRIAASLTAAAWDLAWAAGAGSGRSGRPLLDGASRAAAVRSATEAVLRVIDLPALERQAVAATRARARARGAGPLGRLTSLVYRTSGGRPRSPIRTASWCGGASAVSWDRPSRRSAGRSRTLSAQRHPRFGPRLRERWTPATCGSAWSGRSIGRSAASAPFSRQPAAGGRCSASSRR
jgi:50S ribosome-binding GTPase